MATGSTTSSQPPFDPASLGLPGLAQLFNGNQGGINLEFLQQYGGLVSGGIMDYIRQMAQNHQSSDSPQSSASIPITPGLQTLDNFNSSIKTSLENGKFTVKIPLGKDVKPEDLKVTIKDRALVVDVKVESKAEDGSSRLYQELTKKISLPDEVTATEVKTILSPEGILVIEAPLPQAQATRSQMIQIPVTMDLD